jgi:hypothetical protein
MLHWLQPSSVCLDFEFSTRLMDFFSSRSYLTATEILEQITRKCLLVREPIENQQSLLLPLLAMIGFLTKISEISTRENFMAIVKSTEIFGIITLLYKTMSLGEFHS